MEAPLRPDLGRILPLPALRRLAGAADGASAPLLERSLVLAASRPAEDFLIDVRKPDDHDAGAPGFGIAQALAVADRVAAWFRHEPQPAGGVQRPSHERTRPFLAD